MECKKIQERLMTDYLDNELEPQQCIEIDRHLAACADCRELLETVRLTTVAPFKEAREVRTDPVVWQRIQEKIFAEKESSAGWMDPIRDFLRSVLIMPSPVFRAAFVTALILMIVVFAKWPSDYAHPAYTYIGEQMNFLGELRAGNTELLGGELNGYDLPLDSAGK